MDFPSFYNSWLVGGPPGVDMCCWFPEPQAGEEEEGKARTAAWWRKAENNG